MSRGKDPGADFDAQWEESRRKGREQAREGTGPWAEDKYLERVNRRLSGPPAGHRGPSSCLLVLFLAATALTLAANLAVQWTA